MSEIDRMYEVADDYEAQTLEDLRVRAGILWRCLDENGFTAWVNHESADHCEHCGRPRAEAEREADD